MTCTELLCRSAGEERYRASVGRRLDGRLPDAEPSGPSLPLASDERRAAVLAAASTEDRRKGPEEPPAAAVGRKGSRKTGGEDDGAVSR